MRVASEIILGSHEQAELTKLVRSRLTGVRLAQPCAHRAAGGAGPAKQGYCRADGSRPRAGRSLAPGACRTWEIGRASCRERVLFEV